MRIIRSIAYYAVLVAFAVATPIACLVVAVLYVSEKIGEWWRAD